MVASSNTWTSGTSRSIQFVTDGKSMGRPFWSSFPDGFPSGKIGLYINVAGIKFNDVSYWQVGASTPLTARWTSYVPNVDAIEGGSNFDMIDPTTDTLTLGGWSSLISPEPVLLNNLTLARFQATFSVNYEGSAAMNFLFDAQGTDLRYLVGLQSDGTNVAVTLTGPDGYSISPSSSSVGITSIGSSDTVWVQVELTGTTLVVKRIKSATAPSDSDWASATDVYTFTGLALTPK
ncbi:MAG TPA: hypothetical protein VHQ47_03235 [Phycisphaerae bacterium]|nr:hypothetical protein [Phycisphaerae bacterium]